MHTSRYMGLANPTTPRRGALLIATGLTALLSALPTVPQTVLAQATVYRCTAPDGGIEFRQHPCAGQDREREIEIRDNTTGWVPPAPAPRAAEKTKRKPRSRSATDHADRNADRCWQKRQQLQRVDNELRAGYKPARGERLKRRRREYEAYLNHYCR